jgi:type IV secretory pathway VirB10-like protein
MAKKSKLDRFKAAAKDLNKTIGIEPPIETEDVSIEVLTEKLLEAKSILYKEDPISKNTQKVLDYISAERAKAVEEAESATADQEKPAEEPKEPAKEKEVPAGNEEVEAKPKKESSKPKEPKKVEKDKEPAEEAEEINEEELRAEVEKMDNRKKMLLAVKGNDFFEPIRADLKNLKTKEALKDAMLALFSEDAPVEDSTETPAKEAEAEEAKPAKEEKPKKKAEKKPTKKKAKKKDNGKTKRTPFNSFMTSQSGAIDLFILDNVGSDLDVDVIADEVGATKSRVMDHLRSLQTNRGVENLTVKKENKKTYVRYDK